MVFLPSHGMAKASLLHLGLLSPVQPLEIQFGGFQNETIPGL